MEIEEANETSTHRERGFCLKIPPNAVAKESRVRKYAMIAAAPPLYIFFPQENVGKPKIQIYVSSRLFVSRDKLFLPPSPLFLRLDSSTFTRLDLACWGPPVRTAPH